MRAPVELEAKKSVADLSEADLKGKKVLIRCDLNVPIKEGVIGDDTRIRASVPTVKYLLDKGAKVAMCSHLGRPKDGPEDKFSLGPVATRMGEQLGKAVKMAPDCIGDEVASIVDGMGDGEALLLENTRFYKEETKNDAAFVEKLAAPFDLFVNDAFGTAHRAHASTEGVTKYLSPSVSGYLLAKELEYLAGAVDEPVARAVKVREERAELARAEPHVEHVLQLLCEARRVERAAREVAQVGAALARVELRDARDLRGRDPPGGSDRLWSRARRAGGRGLAVLQPRLRSPVGRVYPDRRRRAQWQPVGRAPSGRGRAEQLCAPRRRGAAGQCGDDP